MFKKKSSYILLIIGIFILPIMSFAVTNTTYANSSSAYERILFLSRRDGNLEIYSMRPDGTDVRRLTFYAGNDNSPSFSPDGSKIVFTRNETELRVMDAYQGDPDNNSSELLATFSIVAQPKWSPDGSIIVFKAGGWPPHLQNCLNISK